MLSIDKRLKAVGFAANPTGSVSAIAYYFDDTNIPFEKIIITKDSYGLTSSIVKAYHGGSTTYSYDSLYRLTVKTTKYSANSPFEVNYTYNTSSGNIVRNSLKQEFFKVGSKQDSRKRINTPTKKERKSEYDRIQGQIVK